MRDRELINRFCAFQILPMESYRGDMDLFLAQALQRMNESNKALLDSLSAQFRTSLKNNVTVFGSHAFRKHTSLDQYRSTFNASLWDVMTTGLSRYPEHVVEARADAIRAAFYPLLDDPWFSGSITLGTNQVSRVKARFEMVGAMLRSTLGDHAN
jgi:hypothetical protein